MNCMKAWVRIAALMIASCASTAAIAADPIHIGLSEPLSGLQASLGDQDSWGAELAVVDIKAPGSHGAAD
jgi:ABC-type branched-subunit amino acid transport system substrate-binding protein